MSQTGHNTVTLPRTMLARQRAERYQTGFCVPRSSPGIGTPPLESRQITPPTPEQVWALIGAAKELGGFGYGLAYTGVRRNEALALRFNDIEWFGNEVMCVTQSRNAEVQMARTNGSGTLDRQNRGNRCAHRCDRERDEDVG